MLDIGTRVIYKPVNWVNGKCKKASDLYGKKGTIYKIATAGKYTEPIYWVKIHNIHKLIYASREELEVIE